MMWFRVDDKFPDHPKVRGLEASHIALWLVAGCWCAEYETDGLIPREVAYQLAARFDPQGALVQGEPTLVTRLCHVRGNSANSLWKRTETGYEVHDFLDYNPSHAKLELARKQERRRRQKGRRAQVVARKGVGANVARTRRKRGPNVSGPDPTRPVVEVPSFSSSLTEPLGEGKSEGKGGAVGRLVDLYRGLPAVNATIRDGPVIAGLVGRYGPVHVEAVIQDLDTSIGAATNPLQYLAGACRRPRLVKPTLEDDKAQTMRGFAQDRAEGRLP